ncbi:hypothetical protein SAMN04487910_3175 [Aquimarina amphilecti]|uniref:Dolichyl-phosphate-mannose-protein mannosyltransferase n=1 Tax=Aquimarina amphilecti TaxID=1038014 RepID=A0A1H7SHY9_AQUAM|nr:hypothetical protein [Aquimarina amphilecti]SEL72252.1 hypothetical protein SAMN04487910_3175 [Aquimarina amphilecti]
MQYTLLHRLLRIFLYLFVCIYVVWVGVVVEPDTMSYVGLSLITPPGYGTFLFVFRKLFGEDNYYYIIVFVQLILCFVSCVYVVRTIKKVFDLDYRLILLIEVMLLAPVIIPEYLTVNRIVTQGLAYPCFLMISAFLIQYLFLSDKRMITLLFLSVFAGLLIRTQFFFILPILFLILVYRWYISKNFRQYLIPIIFLLLMPILVSVTQKTFHYVVHGKYINISSTGLQVMIMPFFVADEEDYQIYEDSKVQEYYKHMYSIAYERKLLDDFYMPVNDNVFHHFDYNFVNISYGVFSIEGRRFLMPSDPDSLEALIANDVILKRMWLPLLFDNFWKCVDLFYKNVAHAFGGFYMIWLCLLLLISSFYIWIKRKEKLGLLAFVFLLLTFSNVLLICVVQHSIGRYLIYHQWMLPVLFILLLDLIIKHKNKVQVEGESF